MDQNLLQRGFDPEPLSSDRRSALDERGFFILEDVIDGEWLSRLRVAFDEIFTREGENAGIEVKQVEGVRRLADLVNKGEVFDRIYLEPQLLTAVHHVIQRPFKLHSLNGHDPLPGGGLQALHVDWVRPDIPRGVYDVVNSMWMLDDFSLPNGATRLIPGSHRVTGKVEDHLADRMADHPDQVHLIAPAGSVAIFNGNVWHSSYVNRTNRTRRTLHCAFVAREHAQQTDQRQYLRRETAARLSPLGRYILDVD